MPKEKRSIGKKVARLFQRTRTTDPLTYTPTQLAAVFLPLRAVIVLLLPMLFVIVRLPRRHPLVLWGTFALALASLLAAYLLERNELLRDRGFCWILPLVDLVLITLLHWASCGAVSPFFPLYYVPIAYAGLLLGYLAGLLISLGAALAYGFLYLLGPRPELWMAWSVALLFPMGGLISGYLGHHFARINALGQSLLEQARALHDQVEERRQLYERWYRAVDRLKADFVYSASHELRTPITPVKGYLQLLLSSEIDFSAERRQAYMRIVANNVDLLAQLIDDIIYLQRVTRIPIDLEEVALPKVAQAVVQEMSTEAEEADVEIDLIDRVGLPPVLGSSDSLKLVLSNLLESVIRDSPEGSRVQLSLQSVDGGAEIQVSGPAQSIPVEQQERIFDLFFHADSSPTYVLGREGLSLAIARYIVEMHGGKITVDNQPRGGLVFTAYLPGCSAGSAPLPRPGSR